MWQWSLLIKWKKKLQKSGPIYVDMCIAKKGSNSFFHRNLVLESTIASQLMLTFLTEKYF